MTKLLKLLCVVVLITTNSFSLYGKTPEDVKPAEQKLDSLLSHLGEKVREFNALVAYCNLSYPQPNRNSAVQS